MPRFLYGKSMMCPTDALTAYPGPRYLRIVFAFAGDSTITRDLPEPGLDPLPVIFDAVVAVFLPAAFFAVFLVVDVVAILFQLGALGPIACKLLSRVPIKINLSLWRFIVAVLRRID